MFTPLLDQLIQDLTCLPGVGKKSAQRMAFHLLDRDRKGAAALSESMISALEGIGLCEQCRMFAEGPSCNHCASASRQQSQLCVVEGPADVAAIEQGHAYRGLYFVLHGHLSPIDGIGPEELGLSLFESRLDQGEIEEIIIATNATVEGEATAHYLAELARRRGLNVSRIAQGVPMGGELEYVDGGTLAQAFAGRRPV